MRIAFVAFELGSRDSDANERLLAVATLLRDRGHDIHVLCTQFWDDERTRYERDGIVYHAVTSDLESTYRFSLKVPFVLRSIDPDVVHAGATPATQVRAAKWGARVVRTPLFLEWYDTVPEDRHQRVLNAPERVITPSRLVETRLRAVGADDDQLTVIPNAIDLERVEQTPPGERVDIVYARKLDAGANLESLLLALAELRTRGWQALVIGDGPERETYERLASDLRIDDRVTFAGSLALEERIATYRSAHVFVQTAKDCVFPTELLWALAAGCVGIVEYHTNSSAHELVEGWSRGFRTTSEQDLTEAIVEAADCEYRDYDEEFARFDRTVVTDRYLELYGHGSKPTNERRTNR